MRRYIIFLTLLFATLAAPAGARKFYSDDPLPAEPKPRDASKAVRRKISDYYDFFQQLFAPPVKKGKPAPAQGVNTLGEAMEGDWFRQRHYYHPMSIGELVRGPGNENAPSMEGKWKVVRAKTEGITPGFEIVDSRNRRYVLKFDPVEFPEIATAPDVLVSKFFHALGYHVPQNYIVYFDPDQLELGEDVTVLDKQGRARKMTKRDVVEVMMHVPMAGGKFRGGASLYLDGKPMGPFKYFGTRRDDPNDIIPHEDRRDLRGLSVFCAWLGHDDSRAINTQDMLVTEGGVSHIRHHLIDFGSTLGSASSGWNTPRSGFEYIFDWGPAAKQFLTLGLWVPGWSKAKYPDDPAIGRFEAERFDAAGWVPEYPNPAFTNRQADDGFWGAKQVMAFTDEQIRSIVKTGQYTKKASEEWIIDCLIKRRDKIGRAFFARVLPLDRFAVKEGQLRFDDLGVMHKFDQPRQYQYQWSVFDNETGKATAITGATSATLPRAAGEYLSVAIHGGDTKKTVTVYVRARDQTVVGIERAF
jgi:hypothetical protein